MLISTMLVLALPFSASSNSRQLQDPWATPPGPHFKTLSDSQEIEAFDARIMELSDTQTLAKFGEKHLIRLTKKDYPEQPDWQINSCYLTRLSGLEANSLLFFRAGETPLRKGFRLKLVYHIPKNPDVVRYYRFVTETYKASSTNIGIKPEKEFAKFRSADYVILLDSKEFRFKLAGSMHLYPGQ